jgi:IS5 family transposase
VVHRKNAELADLAETAANEAERLLANAKRALRKAKIDAEKRKANGHCDAVTGRRRGRLVRAVNDLTELLDATRKIVEQTRERLAGRIPDGATRQVSLHDPDARPIRKGRLGKPVEFGHKAQLVDNDDGIVLDHDVQPGNPADGPRLKPAVERVIGRTRRKPRTVTAATARPASTMTCTISVSETSSFLAGANPARPDKPRNDSERSGGT